MCESLLLQETNSFCFCRRTRFATYCIVYSSKLIIYITRKSPSFTLISQWSLCFSRITLVSAPVSIWTSSTVCVCTECLLFDSFSIPFWWMYQVFELIIIYFTDTITIRVENPLQQSTQLMRCGSVSDNSIHNGNNCFSIFQMVSPNEYKHVAYNTFTQTHSQKPETQTVSLYFQLISFSHFCLSLHR